MPTPSLLDDSLSLLRDHLSVLLSSAAFLATGTWIAARAFYLQQITAANSHREVYKAELEITEKRLKELAPQSQATDVSGLLDDLTRKLSASAPAGEPLPADRLVHLSQDADGRSVVLLADKLLKLEAHGYVTRLYMNGDHVQVERFGQFPLSFAPGGRRLFLGTGGQVSENVDMIPGSIMQRVGSVGPDNTCVFKPEEECYVE